MLHRPTHSLRIVWLGVFSSAVTLAVAGDPILFSRPDVPIAIPKVQAKPVKIPGRASEIGDDFDVNAFHPQTLPPQPIVIERERPEPRKTEKRSILDAQGIFAPEKQDEKDAENEAPFAAKKTPTPKPYGFSGDASWKDEDTRALSPIRQSGWDTRDRKNRDEREEGGPGMSSIFDGTPLGAAGSEKRERKTLLGDAFTQPGQREGEKEQRSLFSFMTAPAPRELSREQLERRAQFEKLLKPDFAPLGSRTPDPFASAPSLDAARTAAPAPALAPAPGPAPQVGSLNPAGRFADPQQGFRPPTAQDFNRKALGSSVPAPITPSEATPATPPQFRQPGQNDFPTRKF
jgi:hypothetical protein